MHTQIIPAHTNHSVIYDHTTEPSATQKTHLTFRVQKNAQLDLQLLITNTQQHDFFIDIFLEDEHAHATINGVYILDGNENITITTRQIHKAPHTESSLTFHGVLNDASQVTYKGLVTIEHSAPHSNATQQNKNILLSKKARAISIPSLEALHHDVQCAHGSAIGQFDAEQLFYMQSRGIKKNNAKKLLLYSFLNPVITKQKLQEKMTSLIDQVIID